MDNKELSMACGQKLDQRVNQIKRTVLNGRDLDIAYVVCTPAFDFEEIQGKNQESSNQSLLKKFST